MAADRSLYSVELTLTLEGSTGVSLANVRSTLVARIILFANEVTPRVADVRSPIECL